MKANKIKYFKRGKRQKYIKYYTVDSSGRNIAIPQQALFGLIPLGMILIIMWYVFLGGSDLLEHALQLPSMQLPEVSFTFSLPSIPFPKIPVTETLSQVSASGFQMMSHALSVINPLPHIINLLQLIVSFFQFIWGIVIAMLRFLDPRPLFSVIAMKVAEGLAVPKYVIAETSPYVQFVTSSFKQTAADLFVNIHNLSEILKLFINK